MDDERPASVSRRHLLAGMGTAGAALAVTPAPAMAAPASRSAGSSRHLADPSHFGRMFADLPPFADPTDRVRAALLEVGRQGGIMDARDDLSAGPRALILDPAVNGNPTENDPYGSNPDNPTMTAGSTFVGQFIDHDITFDQTSRLGVRQNPSTSPNTRTALLDLDSVFGGGPARHPQLYQPNDDGTVGPRLRIGSGGVHEDVPRVASADGSYTALLADPRNDENLLVAGLLCAHLLFYNRILDELDDLDARRLDVFPAVRGAHRAGAHRLGKAEDHLRYLVARQITVWHYQWLLVHEHLPQVVGQAMVDAVLARPRFYRPTPGHAFLPIEFGGAAYRFGHSMVRPSYRANFSSGTGDSSDPAKDPFFALVFDPDEPDFSEPVTHDRDDLLGGFPAPRRYVGWQTFFDAGDGNVKPNKRIDPTISSVLFTLPRTAIAPHTQHAPLVLPQRNLLRQLTWGLPSGQSLARRMGTPVLEQSELSDIRAVHAPFSRSTPLWYYVLAEARSAAQGLHLGPVGGRIVAETLIGLLRADPTSYLSAAPGFEPFLGTDFTLGPSPTPTITGDRSYTRAHFLHYARVLEQGSYR
ncbi:MAG: peroxidase family protein [Propionibacteriaceae bacterium]